MLTLALWPSDFTSEPLKKRGRHLRDLGHRSLQGAHFFQGQIPILDLGEFRVGHIPREDRPHSKCLAPGLFDLFQHTALKALHQTDDDDHCGDADDDAKRREGRAHLVGLERAHRRRNRFLEIH